MATIFLSHSTKDKTAAQQLKAWLEAEGRNHHVFLDDDIQTGIKAGANWEQALYEQLRVCRVFLPVLTQNWIDSKWCFAEMTHARSRGKLILPIKLDPALDTSSLFTDLQQTPIDLSGEDQSGYGRLQRALEEEFVWNNPQRAPYPGLLAFQEDEAAIYRGRDPEITSAIEMLEGLRRRGRSTPHFVLLLGASGSGKSSLVRAGILPRLRRKNEWLLLPPFMPRVNPLNELAETLTRAFKKTGAPRQINAIQQTLIRASEHKPPDGSALLELAREYRVESQSQDNVTLLLVIDQAEELFAVSNPQQAEQFLSLLRAAIEQSDGRLMVLATMRSEFLSSFQAQPFLIDSHYTKPFDYQTFPLDPLPTDRFREIIREPAALAGLVIDDELVERMVADTGTRDALPLLAYTLRRLWDSENYRKDGRFELNEYLDLGGLEGSIRKAADEALDLPRLNPEELAALKGAFVPTMVKLSHEDEPVRQRTLRNQLTAEASNLLQPFINNRLLITDKDTDGHETLEVAHEALLRVWPQLENWINEDRDKLHLFNSLERAAKDWHAHDHQSDLLVHKNDRLKELFELVRNTRFQLREDSVENAYLIACEQSQTEQANKEIEEQERRVKDAEQIASEQKKSAQIFKRGFVFAGILLCFALFAIDYAFNQKKIATHNEFAAKHQEKLAKEKTEEALEQKLNADANAAKAEAALIWSNLVFDEGKISPEEVETLWKLATVEESVHDAFVDQFLVNEKLGSRFAGKSREITRVLMELDDRYTQKTIHRYLSTGSDHNKQQIYILVASLLIKELASVEGLEILVEMMSKTKDLSQLAALENGLTTLAAKIDTESAQLVSKSIVVAIENTDDPFQLAALNESLAALPVKIDSESAQQVVAALLVAIRKNNDPFQHAELRVLNDSLVALAAKIDAESAQQVVPSLLVAIVNADNYYQLEALSNILVPLAEKLDVGSVQQVVASLLDAIENADNYYQLEALGNIFVSLVAKIDADSAQSVFTSLLRATEEKGNFFEFKVFGNNLAALAAKIDAASAQQMVPSLLVAIENADNYDQLEALGNIFVSLAKKIDAGSVQQVVASLLVAIENANNYDQLEALGNIFVSLVTKIDAASAQQQVAPSLLAAIEKTDDPFQLEVLSKSLLSLDAKIDAELAQQVVASFLVAIEKTENLLMFEALVYNLAEIAALINVETTQEMVTWLLTAIQETDNARQFEALVNGLVVISIESTQKVVIESLLVAIEKTENSWQLATLVRGLVTLDVKIEATSNQQAVASLLATIEKTEDPRQLVALAKGLAVLDVRLDATSAQQVITSLVAAIEKTEHLGQLKVLVKDLVALDIEIDAASAQKIVKSLLIAFDKTENSRQLKDLGDILVTLAAKIDKESAQKAVTSLLIANWMMTWTH